MAHVQSIDIMGVSREDYDALPWAENESNGTRWKTLEVKDGGNVTFFLARE